MGRPNVTRAATRARSPLDYYGLNAQVGIQVIHPSLGSASGYWQTVPMSYDGNQDGNSRWTFTPADVLPDGATVNFYFHGWDYWGGQGWDSNGGANYSFIAESNQQFIGDWGSELRIPSGSSAHSFDYAAWDGTLYAVWQEGGYWADGGYQPATILFARKDAGHSWQLPRQIAAGSYPAIAASAEGVFVLYTGEEWPQTASLISSADRGNQWGLPVEENFMTRYARLRAEGTSVYVIYNEFAAPETSDIYFRRKAVSARSWESAQYIFGKSIYKATVNIKDFDVHGDQIALSSYMQSWYGGYSTAYYHESADGGLTWQEADHGLDSVQIASDAAGNRYVMGYASTVEEGGIYLASKTAGSAWSVPAMLLDGYNTASGLQLIGTSLVAVFGNYTQPMEYSVSPDGGQTWSDLQPAGVLGGTASANMSDGSDLHLFYYSGESLSTGEHGQGDPMWWAGNVSATTEDLSYSENPLLWIHTESWPAGTASEVYLVFSADGGDWQGAVLSSSGLAGNNDKWNVSVNGLAPGTHVQYAIQVIDNLGNVTWLNNGGQNYHATVTP